MACNAVKYTPIQAAACEEPHACRRLAKGMQSSLEHLSSMSKLLLLPASGSANQRVRLGRSSMLAMSGEKKGGSSEGTGLVVREREREKNDHSQIVGQ